jgi:hypothetical protein
MPAEQPSRPPQHQSHEPGLETEMTPKPQFDDARYRGSGKLANKVALITGGDSGIGRAVAVAFAKEGADIAIVYLEEHQDAEKTQCWRAAPAGGHPKHYQGPTRKNLSHEHLLVFLHDQGGSKTSA